MFYVHFYHKRVIWKLFIRTVSTYAIFQTVVDNQYHTIDDNKNNHNNIYKTQTFYMYI